MGKCVQTDVPDIFTGSEKGSRNVLISLSAKEQALPKFHHTVGEKKKNHFVI